MRVCTKCGRIINLKKSKINNWFIWMCRARMALDSHYTIKHLCEKSVAMTSEEKNP